ncbi:MAG: HAD hydrolase family protein, partial [Bdellovibrionales bacterium]|nr:HAD hydrolase family protein [Bdellovibrionales bacterium]
APNVISGLQARGIQVVLASGRPMFSVASIAHQLGISPGPLVALNGAHIRHADKSEGFQSIGSILDWEAGIAQTIAAGFVVNLYTASHWLNSDHKHKATQHEIAQMGRLPDGTISERNLPPSEQILKLFVQKENIQTEVLPWRPSGLHCYRSGNSVDLVAFEQTDLGYEPVSKRHGLSKILGNTTALSSVLAFGDGDNDAQMLAHVGYGVTMKNGDERAIESADHVIEPGPNSILRFLTETFGL